MNFLSLFFKRANSARLGYCIRELKTSVNYASPRASPVVDPGMGRRRSMLTDREEKRAFEDEESFEEMEDLNFMNVDKAYVMHKREMKMENEKIQRKIEYRKCFAPPKPPNMLTWAEKLQIKELYEKDPEEWSVQVLADTFPATKGIIWKVIKGRGKPRSLEHLKRQDTRVHENWKLLEDGKLNVSQELLEHYKKFIPRREQHLNNWEANDEKFQEFLSGGKLPELKPDWNNGQMLDVLKSYENSLKKMEQNMISITEAKQLNSGNENSLTAAAMSKNFNVYRPKREKRNPDPLLDVDLNVRIAEIAGYGESEIVQIKEKIKEMNERAQKQTPKDPALENIRQVNSVSEETVEELNEKAEWQSTMENARQINSVPEEEISEMEDNDSISPGTPIIETNDYKPDISQNSVNNSILDESQEITQKSKCNTVTGLVDVNIDYLGDRDKIELANEEKALEGTFFWCSKPNANENTDIAMYEKPTVSSAIPNVNSVPFYDYGYPEKITIPKDKWKAGVTFQVRDCFYDDDGEFLYRVPGLTGVNKTETVST